jgi:methyl-accepting chemotaxis protein
MWRTSSSASGEIAKDISGVNLSAEQLAQSGSQVKQSSETLADLAVQLKELVGVFKV